MKERNERPWFRFYVSDWLDSETVRAMSIEERYSYITLLAHAWRTRKECSLPVSGAELAVLIGVKQISKRVLRQFPLADTAFGPRRRNTRLFDEWKSTFNFRDSQSEKAKIGWKKRKNQDGLPLADVCQQQHNTTIPVRTEQTTTNPEDLDAEVGTVRWLVEAFRDCEGRLLPLQPKEATALKKIINEHGWDKTWAAYYRFLKAKPWNKDTIWPARLFIEQLEIYL